MTLHTIWLALRWHFSICFCFSFFNFLILFFVEKFSTFCIRKQLKFRDKYHWMNTLTTNFYTNLCLQHWKIVIYLIFFLIHFSCFRGSSQISSFRKRRFFLFFWCTKVKQTLVYWILDKIGFEALANCYLFN